MLAKNLSSIKLNILYKYENINVHAVYDLSYFQNNLRPAHNKRYTQKLNLKKKLRFAFIIGKDQCSLIYWAKAYKTEKQHLSLIQYQSITIVGLSHIPVGNS